MDDAAGRLGARSMAARSIARLLTSIPPRRRSASRRQRDGQKNDPNYKPERFLHVGRDPTGPKAHSGAAVSGVEQEQVQPTGDRAAGNEVHRPPAKACAEPAKRSSQHRP